ncbi:TonB-dependent receptor [Dysgonomonas hofstadii]|uniref:TonB-dependent receptor n=1 Tax=Dysgonomonas hofstadii TaxID=637886 RepID=A0A840CSB1_9BACT|nr:TonB-dependent receptor [Dysgonomonas hofstadii]MBB4035422.1 TonB-dependent receptor [Dysgonomonas hofstadii]
MKILLKTSVIIVILLLCTTTFGYSQGKGILTGKVIDNNGEALPGASVVVKGTTIGTASDLNGHYMLNGLESGKITIVVKYLGFDNVEEAIDVKAGGTLTKDFVMMENAKALGEVVVSGMVAGQQRALNQQKAADNMMQVVSADEMGRFPDLNVAEALQRLSGVTISRSRGEGSAVQLRGTPANFVNIQVNGEQMMGSTEDGSRNTTLDVIPSDILSSMEVQKTLLPSNDGDAIAGVINMRTGTARSLKPRISIDISSGFNVLREKLPVNVKAGFQKRFFPSDKNPDGLFGIAANASYYKTNNGYDRLEADRWRANTLLDAKGNKIEGTEGTYVPTDFRYRYQEGSRTRTGGTITLDYAPDVKSKIVLSFMYNRRDDDDTRYRRRIRYRGGFFDMGDGKIGTDRVTTVMQVTDQRIKLDNYNFNLDGETTQGNWKLDAGAFLNISRRKGINPQFNFETPDWRANGKDIKGTDDGNGKPIQIKKNTVLAQLPSFATKYLASENLYTPAVGGAMDDPSRFSLKNIENNDNQLNGRNITVRGNAALNYLINDEFASNFSFGVKGKFMFNERYRLTSSTELIPNGDPLYFSDFLYRDEVSSNFLNGNLNFGPAPSLSKVKDFLNQNPDRFDLNEHKTNYRRDAHFYEGIENVVAGYIMNKSQFNKLMVIVGVRLENTNVDYKANRVFQYDANADPNVNGGQLPGANPEDYKYTAYTSTPADSSMNYTMILPNLQFKYDVAKNTILRLAWTTGYSRPNLPDIVPSIDINDETRKLLMGNPSLKPAYAHNLDLLFEHYLQKVGLLSGGVFYKHIDKFLYRSEGLLTDTSNPYYKHGAEADDQYILTQPQNGKNAYVYGAELTFNSTLYFLPGFLKNLVFTSNYTFTNSKATTDASRGKLRLPGQAKHTGNIALSYSTEKLTLQASANYNGEFTYALGSNNEEDLWVDKRWQLDLNGSYRITKGLTVYAEATNVLNAPAFIYMGNKSRVYDLEYTGVFLRTGFSYRF